ncbi:hypothetical protein CANARDRAFT_29950 [[Candida] arabinofermentans NRRL YB-2248]|uniref:Triosephosphate isomerase n=1 Tax=[Candida] arabinofermentans NRRL YB-2248 TaxID=983967 RepID=A0A1E4SVG8_9ASCO|nr:hypothetical protein CANARDRAFT_29950 [[Candida] arabinofermentans NRRL YB-2248]
MVRSAFNFMQSIALHLDPNANDFSSSNKNIVTNNCINLLHPFKQARTFFVGGNFKMNGSKASIQKIVEDLNAADLPSNVEVVIAPPAPYLAWAVEHNKKSTVSISAQNCFDKSSGAYTGEISPESLKDLSVPWVILGHSERRTIFKETDELIASKTKFALDSGLKVILCIGETYEEKQAGETLNVCKRQLQAAVDVVSDWTNVVVAYEPVWAIGTGLAATAEDAQAIHKEIRDFLATTAIGSQAEGVRILYGGSVNGKNAVDFKDKADVDGFLVGGASLKPEFINIIKSRE